MIFTPKLPNGDVNISHSHPLKEAAWLVVGLLTILVSCYFCFGWLSSLLAMHLPVKAEVWIGNPIALHFEDKSNDFLQHRLNKLIQALPDDSPMCAYTFRAFLDEESEEINAMALPGGSIIVNEGLLQIVQSENELDMILAHELGHFAHRDHLQSMARSLPMFIISLTMPGDQSSNITTWITSKIEKRYSQRQEVAADAWALDLLNRLHGHVGGATDFFKRLAGNDKNRFRYFLATHPHPGDRVQNLKNLITQHGYSLRATIPLQKDTTQ